MNLNGSGHGQMVGFCDHSNESSGFTKASDFQNRAKELSNINGNPVLPSHFKE